VVLLTPFVGAEVKRARRWIVLLGIASPYAGLLGE
jgi:hypothetical protein